MWWDAATIEAAVTRKFVCSHLLPEEIEALDQPLALGAGLTDGTYWEWINDKAKRIFLILVDIGCPSQVFTVIDDSWEDDDLPISMGQVARLGLAAGGGRDERLDRKFYVRQFHYLIRYLEKGAHLVYQEDDILPLTVVDRRSGLNASNVVDRVVLPQVPGEVFSRRRIPLGNGPGFISYEEFLYEVNQAKNIQNAHLVSYHGSYTHQGFGYVLFTPASDFNLKSLLVTMPASVKSLDKQVRRELVMNWIHCLVDTLCYIHGRGSSHGNIKPSSVLFNAQNNVFYTDLTRLSGEALAPATDRPAFDKESYDYVAPEQWYRPPATTFARTHRSPTLSPESARFSISRNLNEGGSGAPSSPQCTPHLNPQAADIFSLGCVILELLSTQLLKRSAKAFAAHRAAKHKTAGRGGAVLDASFHQNLGQVETWMTGLAKDAAKKNKDGGHSIFRGVVPMLQLIARMLSTTPSDRPTAPEIERRMYHILTEDCGIREPHCVHQYGYGGSNSGGEGWDLARLKIGEEDGEVDGAPLPSPPPLLLRRPGSVSRMSEPYHRHSRRPPSGSSSGEIEGGRVTPASYGGRSDPGPRAANRAPSWQDPVRRGGIGMLGPPSNAV